MTEAAPPTRPPVVDAGQATPPWLPTTPATEPATAPRPASTPARRPRRKHPARRARMVALASSVAATGGLTMAMAATSHASVGGTASGLASGGATSASSGGTTAAYTDGTYTGTEVTNRYGPVEVQVTITGGKIASVALVESPGDGRSQQINAQAGPILEQEAISAQSSTLDIVSGATYTTNSYVTSLQAALDQAAAANATTAAATAIGTGSK